jgi:hypothetical protein
MSRIGRDRRGRPNKRSRRGVFADCKGRVDCDEIAALAGFGKPIAAAMPTTTIERISDRGWDHVVRLFLDKCVHSHSPQSGRASMLGMRPKTFASSRGTRLWVDAWKLGLAVLIVVAGARAVLAGEGCLRCKCVDPCRGSLMLCCPDDYCRKPMPCVPCPPPCCCPDDYCRKPMPCVPCLPPNCCPDDYCRKPMPCLCWPASPVKYSCGSCLQKQ